MIRSKRTNSQSSKPIPTVSVSTGNGPSLSINQIWELHRCQGDASYFMENYVKVPSVILGMDNIKLKSFQLEQLEAFVTYPLVLNAQPRQSGCTTVLLGLALWEFVFGSNQNILHMAPSGAQAIDILDRFGLMLDSLPDWMKPNIKYRNTTSIQNDFGNKFMSVSQSQSTCGLTLNRVILSEFGHYKFEKQEDIFNDIAPCAKNIIISGSPTDPTNTWAAIWNLVSTGHAPGWNARTIKVSIADSGLDLAHVAYMRQVLPAVEFARQYECNFSV